MAEEEEASPKLHKYPASAPVVELMKETEVPRQLSGAEKFTTGPVVTVEIVLITSFEQPGIRALSRISCATGELKSVVKFNWFDTRAPFSRHSQVGFDPGSKEVRLGTK